MTGIVDFAIRNWRMTIGLMIFTVIGGIIAIQRLPLDAEPDLPVPYVSIRVLLPGVSPEDSERLLIRPMETELKSTDGMKQMNAVAANSYAAIILEFDLPFDQEKALRQVGEGVDKAKSKFPQEAREPVVEEMNTSNVPIIVANLYGQAPERELQALAKELQRQLESIPSVLDATISGERDRVLEAVIDPTLVESLGISFEEIAAAVSQNNALITAGAIETDGGKFGVKLPGLIEVGDDLSNLVIRRNPNGSLIRMSDIATVREGYKDTTTFARFNGKKSVSLEITKRQGENIIETIQAVQKVGNAFALHPSFPGTVQLSYSQDKSVEIYEMVTSLFSSIVNAVILVFIVCIAALGLRAALFVGWAVPASFLMALFMFLIQGTTLNMMIMFGLILAVGVLVDSAIVIVEYADRKLAEGLSREDAWRTAGKRMFWPIVSSTLTTLAAFIPLLFWQTLPGKYMSYFPKTMIFVLTASMLMAIVFLPTMGSLIGPKTVNKDTETLKALSGDGGDPLAITGPLGWYVKSINSVIRFPELVLLITGLVCFIIMKMFGAAMSGDNPKPVEFFTAEDGEQVYVLARARGNRTAADDLSIALEIEDRIKNVQGIKSVNTIAGDGAKGVGGPNLNGPNNIPADTVVKVYTELRPYAERGKSGPIIADLREALEGMAGVETEVISVANGPPVGKDIAIQLSSEDKQTLLDAAKQVRAKFDSRPEFKDTEDSTPLPGIEWAVNVNQEEAGRQGLSVTSIGSAIQLVTEGALVGQYRPLDAEEEIDIRVRYPSDARDLKALDSFRVQSRDGSVPLSSVVDIVPQPQQDSISRRDQSLFYTVQANVQDGLAINKQVDYMRVWLANEANLPASVSYKFLGQEEENAEAAAFFGVAGIAILLMMGIILLLQFNSFYHVFLTLSAVMLSLFGVMFGLTYYPYISIVLCGTGVIALSGIVVNNNIVLIDTFQRLTRNGYRPIDAAMRTAAQRIRPVILTTVTTVVGLMPLVLGWQADIFTGTFSTEGTSTSFIWAPISYVLTVGLGFSTLLTLIVTPVLLAAPYVWKARLEKIWAWGSNKLGKRQTKPTDPQFD